MSSTKELRPNPIFIIGHKRSGSTHLARILNMHPAIYLSNETDILWILYQKSMGQEVRGYNLDGPVGMNSSLRTYGELIKSEQKTDEIFYEFLNLTMVDGFKFFKGVKKTNLRYVGDQKPFQNADPELMKFANEKLPPSYYIHIVRHPKEVLRSCKEFGKSKDGGRMWKRLSLDQILKRWVRVENWIYQAQQSGRYNIIHIKYEDLVEKPNLVFDEIFKFLKVKYDNTLLNKIENSIVFTKKENTIELPQFEPAKRAMQRFGYE